MDTDIIIKAREMLAEITPLKTDCGLLCGHACCKDPENNDAGMLLFPGEENIMAEANFGHIRSNDGRNVFVCDSPCARDMRPLACMIFPLSPVRNGKGSWVVKLDRRAWEMCPLMNYGLNGLDSRFVKETVRVLRMIAAEPDGEAFLEKWETEEKCGDIGESFNGL